MAAVTDWASRKILQLLLIAFGAWGAVALIVLAWALDTDPPFRLVGYTMGAGYAGGTAKIDADVKRDLARKCDVVYSRRLVDSQGYIYTIEPSTSVSAEALEQQDARSPDKLLYAIRIPLNASPGPAEILTPLEYSCNLWQKIRPITMVMVNMVEIIE